MEDLFFKLLNMSITASYLVLAIIVLRLLLKKAPKFITCILWAFVGIRLIFPFSFESVLSLLPSSEPVPQDIMYSDAPTVDTGITSVDNVVNPIITDTFKPEVGASVNPLQIVVTVASIVWVIGLVAMVMYSIISYLRIYKKVKVSIRLRDNIYLCDNINSPFILGIVKPKIYLPSDVSEAEMMCIIAHENAHLKRHDHWWKPLGFMLLTIYWFNPILWVGYVLLCRDIELACDERVIKKMEDSDKMAYSEALLACSVPRHMIMACPLAFGEVGVKSRIKYVLNYKKPAFWLILVAFVICIVVAVGFLTNPLSSKVEITEDMKSDIISEVISMNNSKNADSDYYCADVKILYSEKIKSDKEEEIEDVETIRVYAWTRYSEYKITDSGIKEVSGSHIPMIFTLTPEKYHKIDYNVESWMPRDGSLNAKDIKENFPWFIQYQALHSQLYADTQQKACDTQAEEYFYGKMTDASKAAGYDTNPYFDATVLEVYEGHIVVSAIETSNGTNLGDNIQVNTSVNSGIPVPSVRAGDEIRIYYDGTIQETYPLQVNNVHAIYSLDYLKQSEEADYVIIDQLLSGSATYYKCIDVYNENGVPTLILSNDDNRFALTFGIPNHVAYGTYELKDDMLELTTDKSSQNVKARQCYRFKKVNDSYVYDGEMSDVEDFYVEVNVHYARSVIPDGSAFKLQIVNDEVVDNDSSDEGNFEDRFALGAVYYQYKAPESDMYPILYLDNRTKECSFQITSDSRYYKDGIYELEGNTLKLIIGGGKIVYLFKVEADCLIFDKENSSPLPEIDYISLDNYGLEIPDGAVFEKNIN